MRRVAMSGDTMTLGSGASASIRCTGPGIAPLHLRLVRIASGVRVEPVAAGATVEVNGEALFCKDLEPDDVVALGSLELRWVGARAAPPVRRPRRAAGRGATRASVAASARRPRARSVGAPGWMMVSGVFAVVVIGVVLVLKALAVSNWPHTPSDYVDLAREQIANSQPERALDTLEVALQHADGATRQQALTLQADIRRLLVERAEVPKVQVARVEHDMLVAFEARYLRAKVERSAAREFVRLCDAWLAQHGDVCRRLSEGQSLLRFVEQQRAQYVAAAALGEPDTAADVVFAANACLRFQWRDYRSAIARLDAFLSRQPDAEVQAERTRMLADGEQWLQGKLRNIDNLLSRGDRGNAERDLQQIEKWSLLPEWEGMVQERRARL
ncbi:MAG: hypothetical protein JNM25_08795 [Planctomycetes bacterium]|nr:hypothetical protein [Planctomycetota bacterium]